ncbi:unnamed protein product [Strongylus vulgaris]|uniref:Tyrosine-protein phosphatase domain-containing protein n=1 Tax=Strongylus vulgaris TaxID=40348 RepID=A0A3P7IW94_STRVU|nr:unnamed protein product [Strongylus vulgaris]
MQITFLVVLSLTNSSLLKPPWATLLVRAETEQCATLGYLTMQFALDDFWRMVWQEKAPYIFMLIGRKDKERCAEYWPRYGGTAPQRQETETLNVCGLHISNVGVSSTRDPVFRVTYIRIVNDSGEEVSLK